MSMPAKDMRTGQKNPCDVISVNRKESNRILIIHWKFR